MEEKASNTDSTAPAHPNSRLPQQSISSAPVLAQGPKTECTEKGTATEGSLTDPACQADDDSEIVKWDGENDPEPTQLASLQKMAKCCHGLGADVCDVRRSSPKAIDESWS